MTLNQQKQHKLNVVEKKIVTWKVTITCIKVAKAKWSGRIWRALEYHTNAIRMEHRQNDT